MKKTKSDMAFDIVNITLILIILIVIIYPLYFTVIASFSDPYSVANGTVKLFPVKVTLDSYRNVFKNHDIWMGYLNSMGYTVLGTLLSLALTLPAAYVLSKKFLPFRSILSWYFLFTMYFGGGLIPTYLLVQKIGLLNKPYTLIILGSFSVFNMIVTRVYFETSIPDELYEAANIDGASHFRQFFTIALPLASPIIAVIALYYAVGRWNDYYTALIYLSKNRYMPLQMVLRSILMQNAAVNTLSVAERAQMTAEQLAEASRKAYAAEGMKYSLIFIASAPLLIAYPFVQKYFVKGMMIGSLKG